MKQAVLLTLCALSLAAGTPPAPSPPPGNGPDPEVLQAAIQKNLGQPYVRGAIGQKSFDCSGFVWRVMTDAGIFIKRTTARKYYFCLPETNASHTFDFGNIVFFDDLAHCGIVRDQTVFFHAACSQGTTASPFNGYWSRKICGFRRMPGG